MSIKESIMNIQDRLEKMLKKRRFKKANDERKAAVEERTEYMDCAGKLNQALVQFRTTIRSQVIYIKEGTMFHRDTTLQEDELWDAAIGYMLVQDAQYAMKSLFNYDSIQYAYDLLKSVTNYMNGGKPKFAMIPGVRKSKDRNAAGYLTSDKLIREKEAFLETFFEDLKRTGDIEKCMAAARLPAEVEGERRAGTGGKTGGAGSNPLWRGAKSVAADKNEEVVYELDPNDVDIHEPVYEEAPETAESNPLRDAMGDEAEEDAVCEAVEEGQEAGV